MAIKGHCVDFYQVRRIPQESNDSVKNHDIYSGHRGGIASEKRGVDRVAFLWTVENVLDRLFCGKYHLAIDEEPNCMKNDQGDTEEERDTETPNLFSASDYVGITPDELEVIQGHIANAQKHLANPNLSEDERYLYEYIIFEICSPKEYNKTKEHIASLKNIFATIEQTLNQSAIPGVSSFSQKFDNYPGVLDDLGKHIKEWEGGIESWHDDHFEISERLREAGVLPRTLGEEELNHLIVGKFGKGAVDV